jgi:hypothetical protein
MICAKCGQESDTGTSICKRCADMELQAMNSKESRVRVVVDRNAEITHLQEELAKEKTKNEELNQDFENVANKNVELERTNRQICEKELDEKLHSEGLKLSDFQSAEEALVALKQFQSRHAPTGGETQNFEQNRSGGKIARDFATQLMIDHEIPIEAMKFDSLEEARDVLYKLTKSSNPKIREQATQLYSDWFEKGTKKNVEFELQGSLKDVVTKKRPADWMRIEKERDKE